MLDSTDSLPSDLPTVPDLLSDVGYNTICFGTNGQLDSLCDDIRSFDEYIPNPVRKNLHKIAGFGGLITFLLQLRRYSAGYAKSLTDVNGYLCPGYLITEGIKKRIDAYDEPLFLYAHYKDSHTPYIPPIPYQRKYVGGLDVDRDEAMEIILDVRENLFEYLAQGCPFSETEWSVMTAFYHACLEHVDSQIGEVVDYVRSSLDEAVLVVTADHGDLLGECDLLGHRLVAHDALCHVPLVVAGPTELAGYEGHVQHIDVVRTVLEEVGAETETLQGYDLRSEDREYSVIQLGEARTMKNLEGILEVDPGYENECIHRGFLTALRTEQYKYERSPDKERLLALPDVSEDVSSSDPETVEEFRSKHESFSQAHRRYEAGEAVLSEGRKQQLRDMGYLVD